ncbi:hypothetical protein ACTFIW_006835 [Dictyostelium discoideum]
MNKLIKNSNFRNNNILIINRFFSSKIYTKTGDKGTSALFNGERRKKDDQIFQALGSVDELSSQLGLSKEHLIVLRKNINNEKEELANRVIDEIEQIQCLLLDIGSHIATPSYSEQQFQKRSQFNDFHTTQLENWVDHYTNNHLAPLKNFILPGGGLTSASLHVCRSVCRRSERELITMTTLENEYENNNNNNNSNNEISSPVLRFINRLSDYLFTIARISNKIEGGEESIYRRPSESLSSNNKNNNNSNNNNSNNDNNKYQRILEKHSTIQD